MPHSSVAAAPEVIAPAPGSPFSAGAVAGAAYKVLPLRRRSCGLSFAGGFVNLFECEQIRKTQDEPQWIVAQRLLSHLQYLDSVKSSAKDLSLPKLEIKIKHKTFHGKSVRMQQGRDLMLVM